MNPTRSHPVAADLAGRLRRHRAVRTAGRVVLWAAVVLVVGRGVVSLFAHPAVATPAANRTPAGAGAGGGFGGPGVEALAVRFTADYLTYDDTNPAEYRTRLDSYGASLAGGWDGKGHQGVTSEVVADVHPVGPRSGTVTVAARVAARWVYLAVPVVTTPAGPAVASTPTFVAAPATAPAPLLVDGGDATPTAEDVARTGSAFMTAWAAGTQTVVGAFSVAGAHLAAPPAGVTLAGVDSVTVPPARPDATARSAVAEVRWTDPASGATFTQPYRLGLTQVAGRWLVAGLGPDLPVPSVSPSTKEKK